MCGIFGIVTPAGAAIPIDERRLVGLRDLLTHRGPDDAGLWQAPGVALAHRRLAVLDTTPAGRQPMLAHDGGDTRLALVYNGEIYNDPQLRATLQRTAGAAFASKCDTETLLHLTRQRWADTPAELRGMFAFAAFDTQRDALLLARDQLGIKPLYTSAFVFPDGTPAFAFASEPLPLVELRRHANIPPTPDLAMVSAYLTTIRAVLGARTLFDGVHAVPPGHTLTLDRRAWARLARAAPPPATPRPYWSSPAPRDETGDDAPRRTRAAVENAVEAHLRADVPVCSLLSGGLDSTITTSLASRRLRDLRTYAAGSNERHPGEPDPKQGDLGFAQRAAERLELRHDQAIVTRDGFHAGWRRLVRDSGLPLCTPNEVAIHAVAQRLRADGCVVTISGEGADELFGGYAGPMRAVAGFLAERGPAAAAEIEPLADFLIESNAWVPMSVKPDALRPEVWRAVDQDAWLRAQFAETVADSAAETGADALQTALRVQRRVNLVGLLRRLDASTMRASVEGRTPLADVRVAELAEALPVRAKYAHAELAEHDRTKIALRDAFADLVPADIRARPKASFPLPFRPWLAPPPVTPGTPGTPGSAGTPGVPGVAGETGVGPLISSSGFVRSLVGPAAWATVTADPARAWMFAWPLANLALWAERWGWDAV